VAHHRARLGAVDGGEEVAEAARRACEAVQLPAFKERVLAAVELGGERGALAAVGGSVEVVEDVRARGVAEELGRATAEALEDACVVWWRQGGG
jgi:hypothetical protein